MSWSIGLNIIGKRVGEIVKFTYGNDKNEHTIKILERFETTESTKLSKLYIEADAETSNRLK